LSQVSAIEGRTFKTGFAVSPANGLLVVGQAGNQRGRICPSGQLSERKWQCDLGARLNSTKMRVIEIFCWT
jgi:hypothetical protein